MIDTNAQIRKWAKIVGFKYTDLEKVVEIYRNCQEEIKKDDSKIKKMKGEDILDTMTITLQKLYKLKDIKELKTQEENLIKLKVDLEYLKFNNHLDKDDNRNRDIT